MGFDIRQVANGFIVAPVDPNGGLGSEAETYIFDTWAEASAWLAGQFVGPH